MSQYYGTLQGNRGEATRCGTKGSGMETYTAGWGGAIRVVLWYDEKNKCDRYRITRTSWHCGGSDKAHFIEEGVL